MKSWILIDGSGAESAVQPSNFHSTDEGALIFELEPGVVIMTKSKNEWRAVKPVTPPVEEEV